MQNQKAIQYTNKSKVYNGNLQNKRNVLHRLLSEIKSLRKNATETRKRRSRKRSSKWTGSFRMARSVQPSARTAPDSIKYDLERRIRRQTNAQKQNFYRLLAAEKPGRSPIGGVAKMLMESILASKNKTTGDVVQWVTFITPSSQIQSLLL